jgi:hypothetical protein
MSNPATAATRAPAPDDDLPLKHWYVTCTGPDETGRPRWRVCSIVYGWVDQNRRFYSELAAASWALKQRREAKLWLEQVWRRK